MVKAPSQDCKAFKIGYFVLKKVISIIVAFIVIYFEFSIFISDTDSVGKIGAVFASYSKEYFGYLSYVYLAVVLYPLYKINFSYDEIKYIILKTLILITFFISSLILQSLAVVDGSSGKIGNYIVELLSPFIGKAGLWIVVVIGYLTTFMIIFEDKKDELLDNIKEYITQLKLPKFEKKENKKVNKNSFSVRDKRVEEVVTVKENGDTAEIVIEKQDAQIKKETSDKIIVTHEPESELIVTETKEEAEEAGSSAKIVDELEENKKLQAQIELGKVEKPKDFKLPPLDFFGKPPKTKKSKVNEAYIDKKIADLLEKLLMFKIEGDVVRTYTGPVVTTFEFKPAPNVKVSKILNLQDDLAMALKAETIRIQAPIPGKDVVGIEVPNDEVDTIYIREILESEIFQNAKSSLTMVLGKDIVGKPFITDLKKLPHLLIAGTTGSGKSVGINAMILSLLCKNSPDSLKLVMIDPKMLEFSIYNDIPHLLTPVITRPSEAINALANMVGEMERRYTLMSQTKTKNIESYNEKSKKEGYDPFPYIVVIIDELADLMMTSGKEVEMSIARLAQMARASGIHLIVATQRPSVDVVTGLIKANLPSRISYRVGQKVDSKIILDSLGAESLLGRGDMLFTPPGSTGLVRIHAPWSTESEIDNIVNFLKDQREADYDMAFLKEKVESSSSGGSNSSGSEIGDLDELYEDAKEIVLADRKGSISYIQRKLRIGYNRAATIVEQLEYTGVLSAPNIKGNREILI